MKAHIGKDEASPALLKLLGNTSPQRRTEILGRIAFACATQQKKSIAAELQYDGQPMKSPAKETKFGGRFAKRYNWRYREGSRQLRRSETTAQRVHAGISGGKKGPREVLTVRRRVAVTPASKQLQDTGATIKSIDILSVNAQVARVGPKTGHGQLILSVHDSTRHPLGMSNEFKEKARKTAMEEIWKGV